MELDKIPVIAKEELLEKIGSQDYVILNVLAPHAYRRIHIKNSRSVPFDKVEAGELGDVDMSKKVVTYCASYTCNASRKAAAILREKGYNVMAYEGGIKEWAEAGYPTEGEISPEEYIKSLS